MRPGGGTGGIEPETGARARAEPPAALEELGEPAAEVNGAEDLGGPDLLVGPGADLPEPLGLLVEPRTPAAACGTS